MSVLERNLSELEGHTFDLIVVGGGIFGCCAAWDAAKRGLSVALIEKGDFSHATSANHFKMVHGGIRYLQHGDVMRVRESSRERSALLRIAPHLVQPLPIVIPTYGHGIKGKEFLGAGMALYDLVTFDRNRELQSERRIPRGRFFSRQRVMELFPGIKEKGLTGGAVFCDGQLYNPPRLAISLLRSAKRQGAVAANYLEVQGLMRRGNSVTGVYAQDLFNKNQLEIQGNFVLNTAGPWAHRLLESEDALNLNPRPTFSRDLALVLKCKPKHNLGIAFSTVSKDSDAIFDRGGRHLFSVPWRNYTLMGVWHVVFPGPPEDIRVSEKELQSFVAEVNSGFPGLDLGLEDIQMINTGLTLFGEEGKQDDKRISFGKRSMLVDHSRLHGIEGILTLIGVRATTARGMSHKALDIITQKLGKSTDVCRTESTPVFGGNLDSFDAFLGRAGRELTSVLQHETVRALIHNYGSEYQRVLNCALGNAEMLEVLPDATVLKAEVLHAVREEMAQKMSDVVLRRTDLGTGGDLNDAALKTCARLMGAELGWSAGRMQDEIDDVKQCMNQYRQ